MKQIILASTLALALAAPALAEQPAAQAPKADGAFVTTVGANELSASDWIGAPIKNAKDETIGDINDLVFGANGEIVSVVAGVGGFLGLGEKNVGLPYDSVQLKKNADGERVAMVEISKEELMNAPEFKSDRKTLRQRASEASDAASKAYEKAKENVKASYEAAKEKVEEGYGSAKKAMSEDEKEKSPETSTK